MKAKFDLITGCFIWYGAKQKNGYGHRNVNGKTKLVHRISYEETFGPIPKGMLVCHSCDNRLCINPQHLFLGTHKDNTNDMMRKGRGSWGHTKGERNAKTILKDSEVRNIYRLFKSNKFTRFELSKKFNASWNTINRIVSGLTRTSALESLRK